MAKKNKSKRKHDGTIELPEIKIQGTVTYTNNGVETVYKNVDVTPFFGEPRYFLGNDEIILIDK